MVANAITQCLPSMAVQTRFIITTSRQQIARCVAIILKKSRNVATGSMKVRLNFLDLSKCQRVAMCNTLLPNTKSGITKFDRTIEPILCSIRSIEPWRIAVQFCLRILQNLQETNVKHHLQLIGSLMQRHYGKLRLIATDSFLQHILFVFRCCFASSQVIKSLLYLQKFSTIRTGLVRVRLQTGNPISCFNGLCIRINGENHARNSLQCFTIRSQRSDCTRRRSCGKSNKSTLRIKSI